MSQNNCFSWIEPSIYNTLHVYNNSMKLSENIVKTSIYTAYLTMSMAYYFILATKKMCQLDESKLKFHIVVRFYYQKSSTTTKFNNSCLKCNFELKSSSRCLVMTTLPLKMMSFRVSHFL